MSDMGPPEFVVEGNVASVRYPFTAELLRFHGVYDIGSVLDEWAQAAARRNGVRLVEMIAYDLQPWTYGYRPGDPLGYTVFARWSVTRVPGLERA